MLEQCKRFKIHNEFSFDMRGFPKQKAGELKYNKLKYN